MPDQRSNAEVARAFQQLADYLEVAGDNPFKTRAYRNAAQTLLALREPVAAIASEGRLATLAGFGDAIQAKTKDILATGTTSALEKMRAQIPEGTLELLELPGIGPKTVHQIFSALQVDGIASLKLAIDQGTLMDAPGLGPKMAQKLLDAIERRQRYSGRILISEGRDIALDLIEQIKAFPGVLLVDCAGSIRRGAETVGNVDLTAAVANAESVLDAFEKLPGVEEVVDKASSATVVKLGNGVRAGLAVTDKAHYGALSQWSTGSGAHNAKLAERALAKGFALNGRGMSRNGKPIDTGLTDDNVYRLLGMQPIPPELREDTGEIEAALVGALPKLITLGDIRGNLHTHTTESDGKLTLTEMAAAARSLGYEYLAITDHTHSLAITNGLDEHRVRQQIAAVREAEQSAGIRLLTGTECDIKTDGTMDLPDDLLRELDFAIASIHSRFKMTEDEMTSRMLRAVQNPNVDLVAHPTGRLINSREPYPVNMEKLIDACAATDTALEINASPYRLDLCAKHARQAKDAGVKMIISSDAHSRDDLDLMHYGVTIARHAWLTPADVWNTRSLADLQVWLSRDK